MPVGIVPYNISHVFIYLQIPELTEEQLAELEEKMTEEHFSFIMDLMDDIRMSASYTTVSLYNNTLDNTNRGAKVWVRTGGQLSSLIESHSFQNRKRD